MGRGRGRLTQNQRKAIDQAVLLQGPSFSTAGLNQAQLHRVTLVRASPQYLQAWPTQQPQPQQQPPPQQQPQATQAAGAPPPPSSSSSSPSTSSSSSSRSANEDEAEGDNNDNNNETEGGAAANAPSPQSSAEEGDEEEMEDESMNGSPPGFADDAFVPLWGDDDDAYDEGPPIVPPQEYHTGYAFDQEGEEGAAEPSQKKPPHRQPTLQEQAQRDVLEGLTGNHSERVRGLFKQSSDLRRSGAAYPTPRILAGIIERHFAGLGNNADHKVKHPNEDGEIFVLRLEDILSLEDGQWLSAAMIVALMSRNFPSGRHGHKLVFNSHEFDNWRTITADGGIYALPFVLTEDITEFIGVVNLRTPAGEAAIGNATSENAGGETAAGENTTDETVAGGEEADADGIQYAKGLGLISDGEGIIYREGDLNNPVGKVTTRTPEDHLLQDTRLCSNFQIRDADDRVVGGFEITNPTTRAAFTARVVNEDDHGSHWVAIRASRDTQKVEIFDSLDHEEADQAANTRSVLSAVQRLCSADVHHDRWKTVTWSSTTVPGVFKQPNGSDCGIHAVQNALDVAFDDQCQQFHNAAFLRFRHAVLLGDVMDGKEYAWEYQDTDVLHMTAPPSATLVAGAAPPSTDEDITTLNPGRPAQIEYPHALNAMLKHGPPEGMTLDELTSDYLRMQNKHNDQPVSKKAVKAGLRAALKSRRNYQLHKISDVDTQKHRLRDPDSVVIPKDALMFFGPAALEAFKNDAAFHDDIETTPRLVVQTHRVSRQPGALQREATEPRDFQAEAEKAFDYWERVFWRGRQSPARILSAEDLNHGDSQYFIYKMTRPSPTPIFERRDGYTAQADKECMEILEALNDEELEEPEERHLVIFVVCGVDGWTTDNNSWPTLCNKYPNLDFRLTMIMPLKRVENLPWFTHRSHPDYLNDIEQFAFAHFDLRILADLQTALLQDPEDDIQYLHRPHAPLWHMLDEVHNYKSELPDPNTTDQEARTRGYKIGVALAKRLTRNVMRFPDFDKVCCACGEDTEEVWQRCENNDARVLCDRLDDDHEDMMQQAREASKTPTQQQCSGCNRWLPLSSFGQHEDTGAYRKTCFRCTKNRRRSHMKGGDESQGSDGGEDETTTRQCSKCHKVLPKTSFVTNTGRSTKCCSSCRAQERKSDRIRRAKSMADDQASQASEHAAPPKKRKSAVISSSSSDSGEDETTTRECSKCRKVLPESSFITTNTGRLVKTCSHCRALGKKSDRIRRAKSKADDQASQASEHAAPPKKRKSAVISSSSSDNGDDAPPPAKKQKQKHATTAAASTTTRRRSARIQEKQQPSTQATETVLLPQVSKSAPSKKPGKTTELQGKKSAPKGTEPAPKGKEPTPKGKKGKKSASKGTKSKGTKSKGTKTVLPQGGGHGEEQAAGQGEEQAEGQGEEQAEGQGEEQAEGQGEEQAEGQSEEQGKVTITLDDSDIVISDDDDQ